MRCAVFPSRPARAYLAAMETLPPPCLVDALARAAGERPLDRKVLVAPTFGAGRELLRSLARGGRGWVGFEVTTPRPMALLLARPAMVAGGLHLLDAFEQQALLDEAMDGVMAAGTDGGLGELGEGVGLRAAVHGSVTALRLAGIGPAQVRGARLHDPRKRVFLARVLERYETLLRERHRTDTAGVLALAVGALEGGGDGLPRVLGAEEVLLVPGLGARGLVGAFLEALRRRGAAVLETDPVLGRPVPDGMLWNAGEAVGAFSYLHAPALVPAPAPAVELFRAASINDELREVLRRVMARGLRWDEVEILTPDPAAYGSALHALSARLGVPVTYAVGLPVERTRPGRAAQAYLEWIAGGFQAHVIRRLLEAGDLKPPRGSGYHAPGDLGRRFRALRIGWGRLRYRAQIRRSLAALEEARPRRGEPDEAFQQRIRRERDELEALRSILFPALKATPSVPDHAGEGGGPVSPAELARGMRAFLRRVPKGRGPDAAARDKILSVLERVEATLRRRTRFEAAVAVLSGHLEIRVRAPYPMAGGPDDAGAPWSSEGGHLHLSDFEHGGTSGRAVAFLVGLDADRVPGSGTQDPVLTDGDRRALGGALPTSADVAQERSFRLAALLARLRGSVTLSYSAWSAAEARSVSPSPVLLQALRLAHRDATLTFEDLHRALGPVLGAIPRGAPALDADDVWMQALDSGGVLRPGLAAVRAAFPHLDRGMRAAEARVAAAPGPHHGVVSARPHALDPRGHGGMVLSASRLQDLGACPLRFLYAAVLRLEPPDDPELDPDRWLDALQRGNLLHAAFERILREAKLKGLLENGGDLEPLALEALAGLVRRWREDVPSPGDGVMRREVAGLVEDVKSFVRMVRERGAPWCRLEMKFGMGGAPPLVLELAGGALRLRGAVDRVDEDLAGLHVVDYKTGTVRDHEGGKGAFHGGRRLQHAIYAEAAEQALGRPVVEASYHFPTRRGENEIVTYPRSALKRLPALLGHLLDGAAAGFFVPTDDAEDCRYCAFARLCRTAEDSWGHVTSPQAEWSKAAMASGPHPVVAHLAAARRFEV
jgi:ATP-dependent helicase/nuclease subunit B